MGVLVYVCPAAGKEGEKSVSCPREDALGPSINTINVSRGKMEWTKGGETVRRTVIVLALLIGAAWVGNVFAIAPGKTVDFAGGSAGKVIFDGKSHADAGLKQFRPRYFVCEFIFSNIFFCHCSPPLFDFQL